MPDFERGASPNPEARLEGEILGSLSEWSAAFGTGRLELAYAVAKALLAHVHRTQPPHVAAEWCARTADILGEQARLLSGVIEADRRGRLH